MLAETIEDYSVTEHRKAAPAIALLLTDAQRSVARANTGKTWHSYLPFGHQGEASDHSTVSGFNGERRDTMTGHYWLGNGYRVFNTVLGRFQSSDSLSPFREGGINCYMYCAADPVNSTDPTGHASHTNVLLNRLLVDSSIYITGSKNLKKVNLLMDIRETTRKFNNLWGINILDKRVQKLSTFHKPVRRRNAPIDVERMNATKAAYPFDGEIPKNTAYAIELSDGARQLATEQYTDTIDFLQAGAIDLGPQSPEAQRLIALAGKVELQYQIYVTANHYRDLSELPIAKRNTIRTTT